HGDRQTKEGQRRQDDVQNHGRFLRAAVTRGKRLFSSPDPAARRHFQCEGQRLLCPFAKAFPRTVIQNWSTATTRRISSSGVWPVNARRRPDCQSDCMPCWTAICCRERVGSFCKMASRRTSSTTSISVKAVRPEKPVPRHSLHPTPRRNVASSRSSGRTNFIRLGSG